MASDVPFETEGKSETTNRDGDTNYTSIEYEMFSADNETKKHLDVIQPRNLTLEAKETGSAVIEDEDHKQKNDDNDCGRGIQSNFDKDVCGLQCRTAKPKEEQIKSIPLKNDIIDVECAEISTTVKSECTDVSKSESKRHNVFKSIIDRVTRKEGGRLEHQTKTLFSVADSHCSRFTASTPSQHPLSVSQNPAAIPHSTTSPGILFTNASPSSSFSVCSSSSSALNLSFLFRGFPGHDDSGRSLNSEQGFAEDLPSRVPHPLAKFHGSLANFRVHAAKKDVLEKVGLHSDDDTFLDDSNIFRNNVDMLDCVMQPDPAESHPGGLNRDQSVVCLDLENEEPAASQETSTLGAIKHKYYKSLDYLRKVRVISCTLEKEREKLRLKRLCIQRALHKLRFLYNVTRLRYAKGRTLDRQTISSLWNLAKFEEATKEKQEEQEEDEQKEGEWHGVDKRLETGSDQGSSPRSSPAHFSNRQKTVKSEHEAMQIGCDDDVTTTSSPVNYSLRGNDEKTRGGQCIVSRAQGPTTRNFPSSFRRANPVETEPLSDQFSVRHHLPLIADGTTAWRYINSPLCSADDQTAEQTTDGFAKTNNIPAHSASYSRSNRPDSRKRMEGEGGRGGGEGGGSGGGGGGRVGGGGGEEGGRAGGEEGYAPVNYHRAHITSNRLELNVGRTPAAAHEMKRDLNNFTYLYCNQDRI